MTISRNLVPEGTYHVYNRGNNGMDIFHDDMDRYVFLKQVLKAQEKYKFSMFTYSLMNNHYHFELQDKNLFLSDIMREIQSEYAKFHNKKYNFKGHLFQGPYQSKIILSIISFFRVLRYIIRNPVVAGMTNEAFLYYWAGSSPINDKYDLIDFDFVYDLFSKTFNISFFDYISKTEDDKTLAEIEIFQTDDITAYKLFNEILFKDFQNFKVTELKDNDIENLIKNCLYHKMSQNQIASFTGQSLYKIKKIGKHDFIYL